MSQTITGRRERKKAATRDALASAALRLFLERGFDRVSVKDIADAADVSTTTLFKHFASKESLVFDKDADRETELIAVVRDRSAKQSIPQALCEHFVRILSDQFRGPQMAEFVNLVNTTPALREYGRRMWTRHETALARAIASDIGAPPDDVACATLAHFALQAPNLARNHGDFTKALGRIFDVIEHGWASCAAPTIANGDVTSTHE